ncbi:MAG: glycoside hydrolase family 43 protein [Oscillospiraceae bacterium]|nr:glycoside hydrolase family 43 protein [Oscillospiraceae bacterium]
MLTSEIQIRDPFIFKHDNLYYMFGSTDKDIWKAPGVGFNVHKSSDLLNWEPPVTAFLPPAGFWGTHNFWAPEVYEYQGGFYMFATFTRAENRLRGTAILKAYHPQGPYTPHSNGPVTPNDWDCLDGTLFVDDENAPWIIFCHEWKQIGDGTISAARLSDDLIKTITDPTVLFSSSSASWSIEIPSKSNDVVGYVTDGPFLYRLKSGKLLLLWSCIGDGGYCSGYAISDSGNILGPWKQSPEPLFGKDGGHGMIFRAYDGRLLLTVHTPNKTPNERAMFVELEETDDGLRVK